MGCSLNGTRRQKIENYAGNVARFSKNSNPHAANGISANPEQYPQCNTPMPIAYPGPKKTQNAYTTMGTR